MAREIPEVVRAAAGLAATVLDEARKLPETLPGLPVRMIGLAMQKAMWLQQRYSAFVARGDELFTGIRGDAEPGLATFDDDEPLPEQPADGGGYRESAFDRAADLTDPHLGDSYPSDADLAGLPEDAAADSVVTAVEDVAESFDGAEQVLEELAIEQLVDDEVAGLPAEPAPAEVVAAVEDITDQVAAAVAEEVSPGSPVAAGDTGDAGSQDAGSQDAGALENALLEADAAASAATDAGGLPEPAVLDAGAEPVGADAGGLPEPATEVDILTPDGSDVTTAGATVTDEGVATVEAPAAPDAGSAEEGTVAADEGGGPVAAATGVRTDVDQDAGPVDGSEVAGAQAAGAAPVEGYDGWSIAQLRGRLRGYAPVTVQQLLSYEEATRAREPYLRMLRNRLEKVQPQSA